MSEPKLEFVKPKPNPYVNIVLYGPPKSGKSVGAASAPGPILYLNADRPNATRFAHFLFGDKIEEAHFTGLDTMIAATKAIEDGAYGTVVLDPVAEAYRSLLDDLSGGAMRPKINEYGDAGIHLERFCRWLCDAPVNTVFCCHEMQQQDEATGEVEHLPFTTTKAGNAVFAAKLMAMVDVIGYTGAVETEDEGVRYLAQLVNGRGRRGGDRFGVLGSVRPINLDEWVQMARSVTAPQEAQKEGAAA